jgi:hypothetical protein
MAPETLAQSVPRLRPASKNIRRRLGRLVAEL